MSIFSEEDSTGDEEPLDFKNSHHLEEIVKILSKNSGHRNRRELRNLYRILMTVPFFKSLCRDMPDDLRGSILRELKYKYAGQGQRIVHPGDAEYHFHFILKGRIAFMMKPRVVEKQQSQPVLTGRPHSQHTRGGILTQKATLESKFQEFYANEARVHSIQTTQEFDSRPSFDDICASYQKHKIIKMRKEGGYFGEKAMKFSTSSVVTGLCQESCHLMTLSFSVYNRILKQYQRRAQQEIFDFFKMVPLTRNWSAEALYELMNNMHKHTLKRKSVIYATGTPPEAVFFIKSGEVELMKETDLVLTEEQLFTKAVRVVQKSDFDNKTRLFEMNSIWKSQFNQAQKQKIKIAILGAHQSFGEEEVFSKLPKRKSKAIVKSSIVELFSISAERFIEIEKKQKENGNTTNTFGTKTRWRKTFEHQILELNHGNEGTPHQPTVVDLFALPVEFVKKEDKVTRKKSTKHIRYNSSGAMTARANHAPIVIPIIETTDQLNPISLHPMFHRKSRNTGTSRKTQNSNQQGRKSPPNSKMQSTSPKDHVTERKLTMEPTSKSPVPKLKMARLSSACPQGRSSRSGVVIHSKRPSLLLDNSPAGSTNNIASQQPSYISFVQKAGSMTSRPTTGRIEFIKVDQARASNLSSTRDTPKLIKTFKECESPECMMEDVGISLRKNSSNSIGHSVIGLSNVVLPLSLIKQQASYFSNFTKGEMNTNTVNSVFNTPTGGRVSTAGGKSFTQVAERANGTHVVSESLFSSKASFPGKLMQSKSFKGKVLL